MLPYILYLVASVVIRAIPKAVARQIAVCIAFLFFVLRPKIRRNIALNFEALHKGRKSRFVVFKNFSRVISDFLMLSQKKGEEFEGICSIEGMEHLDVALKEKKGAILILPHIGPWEITGAHLASLGYRIHTVALEHPSERVTGFFSKIRRSWGISDYPPGDCVGQLLQALRNGDVVVLLIDRQFSGRGIRLKLFGKEVLLPDGHVVLSMRTGAALLPCFCYYDDGGLIKGRIDGPLRFSIDGGDPVEIGTMCLQRIEMYIRDHCEQWFAFDHLWLESRDV